MGRGMFGPVRARLKTDPCLGGGNRRNVRSNDGQMVIRSHSRIPALSPAPVPHLKHGACACITITQPAPLTPLPWQILPLAPTPACWRAAVCDRTSAARRTSPQPHPVPKQIPARSPPHLQRLLLARPAACARARRQLLPCLKAVAQLLVVAEAEAQVLQQRLHEGRGAKAGRANAALGRLAHLQP
eukprot:64282-Chlamydomonas_euryale.AAC.1